MKEEKFRIGCLIVAAAGFFLPGWVGLDSAWPQGGGSASVFQSYAKPLPLPDFTLEDLEGKAVAIRDFRGKVILLNFWATW